MEKKTERKSARMYVTIKQKEKTARTNVTIKLKRTQRARTNITFQLIVYFD